MKKADTSKIKSEAQAIADKIELPRIPQQEFHPVCEQFTDISPALNAAIRACAGSGGGRVIVPAGSYRCNGPIQMASCVELHFEDGAFLKFSNKLGSYLPVVLTRWEGVDLYNYSPMIYGNGLHDTAITGCGIICGGRESWGTLLEQQAASRQTVRQLEINKVPLEERIFGDKHGLRPALIQLRDSQRVLFEGFTCIDAPMWMLHPLYCAHVTIRHVNMDSMYVCNDGIDVDSCEDVLIENSHFRNGDDAVVLKSGRDADGLRVNRPCRRVVVRNCVFHECLHGFAIGSELSGGAEDIYVHDIQMEYIQRQAISFKSAPGRGGVIRRVHAADIRIDKNEDHVISFVSEYPGSRFGEAKTCYRDFELLNIHCSSTANGLYLEGSEEFPLENILLENVVIDNAGKEIDAARSIGTVQFKNVSINGKEYTSCPRTQQ
ncbi:MAG: hypothetical protein IKC65_01740 [Lentisphaeria bacterium]|nr:hypothetical protein [Lentisphaeria bacterium]